MIQSIFISLLLLFSGSALAQDPLPAWNDGPIKKAIIRFVNETTQAGSKQFIPPEERIAVFDNDGTLWSEQPIYVQLAFAIDRIKTLAPQNPQWKTQQPFKAVLENDIPTIRASGHKGLFELIAATHAGMSTEAFQVIVSDWLKTARHPVSNRPYTEMVYQPMLELLAYLKSNGYTNYIVSGGGTEFMRPWTQKAYGIPPERIIGSAIKSKFVEVNGQYRIIGLPELEWINDGPNKPLAIQRQIGKRPVIAFGNSDGDQDMLLWTTGATGPRLGGIIHHTDGAREVAYDRKSVIGKLNTALDLAPKNNWLVVDMKKDWRTIFPAAQLK
jgi:phosphoglycolate phosphatase-like HAD superfamily hydrolase